MSTRDNEHTYYKSKVSMDYNPKQSSLSFHQSGSEYRRFDQLHELTFFEKIEEKYEGKIGYYYMLVSVLCMSLNALFAKLLDDLPSVEILFFRSIMVIFLLWLHTKLFDPDIEIDDKKNKQVIIILSGLSAAAAAFYLYGISKLPLAAAVVLIYTAPMFTGILSYIILKLTMERWEIAAAVTSFIGVLFVVRPDLNTADDLPGETELNQARLIGGISCLFHAFLLGVTQVVIRSKGPKVNPLTIVVFTNVFCAIGCPIFMFIQGWQTPSFAYLIGLLFMAAFYFFGQFFLTKSCQHTENVFNVSVLNYLQVPFAFVFDFWIVSEKPVFYTIFGTILIVVSCLFILKKATA